MFIVSIKSVFPTKIFGNITKNIVGNTKNLLKNYLRLIPQDIVKLFRQVVGFLLQFNPHGFFGGLHG